MEKKKTNKDSIAEKTKECWRRKRMKGHVPRNLDEKLTVNGHIDG